MTFLSGTRYVPGALCLRSSMRRVQSRCPLKVVVDDLPGQELSDVGMARLRLAYGRPNVIALSSLVAALQKRLNGSVDLRFRLKNGTYVGDRFSNNIRTVAMLQANGTLLSGDNTIPQSDTELEEPAWLDRGPDDKQQPVLGRRLLSTYNDVFAAQYKAWMWALPWPKIVAIDSDMLVVANIDWMLAYQFEGPVAALKACSHGAHDPLGAFNSGLMIFRPDIMRLPQMLGRLERIHKRDKSCESRATDQTLLNHFFQNRWHKLPSSLLTKVPHGEPQPRHTGSSAMWHFYGEPKPWLNSCRGRKAWQEMCGASDDLI